MTGEQKPVLIVIDDEPGILEVVGRYAARSGFEVIACAGDGGLMMLLGDLRTAVTYRLAVCVVVFDN